MLDWHSLTPATDAASLLNADVEHQLAEYLDGGSAPPTSFRQALAELAATIKQPVLYYACAMWGGDIDHEYCLTYEPNEVFTATEPGLPPERPGVKDSLRIGLSKLGLQLPTGYFALHTRSFPWQAQRLHAPDR